MYLVTYWQDAKIKHAPEDYDEIETIRIKSVNEVRTLIWNRPKSCSFITLERSGLHVGRDGSKTDKYQVRPLWERNNPHVTEYRKYCREVI